MLSKLNLCNSKLDHNCECNFGICSTMFSLHSSWNTNLIVNANTIHCWKSETTNPSNVEHKCSIITDFPIQIDKTKQIEMWVWFYASVVSHRNEDFQYGQKKSETKKQNKKWFSNPKKQNSENLKRRPPEALPYIPNSTMLTQSRNVSRSARSKQDASRSSGSPYETFNL